MDIASAFVCARRHSTIVTRHYVRTCGRNAHQGGLSLMLRCTAAWARRTPPSAVTAQSAPPLLGTLSAS